MSAHYGSILYLSISHLHPTFHSKNESPTAYQTMVEVDADFNAPAGRGQSGSRSVEVKPSAMFGGGMGLFSRHAASKGEVILAEKPFLVIPGLDWVSYEEAMLKTSISFLKIEAAVNALSPRSKDIFWTFGACPIYGEPATAQGIVWTNMIDTDPEDETSGNVFRLTCRLNHSCEPNTKWRYDHGSKMLLTVAVRNIAAGEELFTDYTAGVQDQALEGFVEEGGWGDGMKSTLYLKKWFGFDCCCTKCKREEAHRAFDIPRGSFSPPKQECLNQKKSDVDAGDK